MITKTEGKRGCGFRKPGGLYLMSDGAGRDCGKLPIPLTVCPTCHGGIKPSRGWTWVDGNVLIGNQFCRFDQSECGHCPLMGMNGMEKVGLLWIGEKFYARPENWIAEGRKMGFSRRISAVPKDFVLGETWVFAAHRKAITKLEFGKEPKYTPGVFHIFQPSRIEYVVKGTETDDQLKALEKRGITPVRVVQEE